jgi:hypothetical protein
MATVGITSDGTVARVARGEQVFVRLEEDRNTAYRWRLERLTGHLALLSSTFMYPGVAWAWSNRPERQVWFLVAAEGTGSGAFVLERPGKSGPLVDLRVPHPHLMRVRDAGAYSCSR